MISHLRVKNFRSLKDVTIDLDKFQIFIGPNSSGKSTLFDAIAFVSDFLENGLDKAILNRSDSILDLTFNNNHEKIVFEIKAKIPNDLISIHESFKYEYLTYTLSIGYNESENLNIVYSEKFLLSRSENQIRENKTKPVLYPEYETIVNRTQYGTKQKLYEDDHVGVEFRELTDYFDEKNNHSVIQQFLNAKTFPKITWLIKLLRDNFHTISLDSAILKKPSQIGKGNFLGSDGSNLPFLIQQLIKKTNNFEKWINHLNTAIPELKNVFLFPREEDRSLYFSVMFENNSITPSWLLSEGLLSLMALTILAYLPDNESIYLIEEPENKLHPKAIETVYQSLCSLYDSQVFLTTHSSLLLSLAKPEEILCFSKNTLGETVIIRGSDHPILKNWEGTENLSILFASGILG